MIGMFRRRHATDIAGPDQHAKGKMQFNIALKTEADAVKFFCEATSSEDLTRSFSCSDRFFGSLVLSPNGGMSEVSSLFNNGRYIGMTAFLSIMILNTFNLIKQDVAAVSGQLSTPREEWLIHERWIDEVIPGAWLTPERMFAVFELIGLAMYSASALYYIGVVMCPACGDADEYDAPGKWSFRRWNAVAELLFRVAPSLQAFSTMRMLQYITPMIFTQQLKELMFEMKQLRGQKDKWFRRTMMLPCFIVSRLVFFLFGFEAFVVKFRAVDKFIFDNEHQVWGILQLALFMNQMLGVVQLNIFTRNRIFHFIFGGVDNFINTDEFYRMMVWRAAFMKRAWMASNGCVLPFMSLVLTFSDVDFQQLVLDQGSVQGSGQGSAASA